MSATSVCYLLHFHTPFRHARHYLGTTNDLPARTARHQAGDGARLVEVITQAGIGFVLPAPGPANAAASTSSRGKADTPASARSARADRLR